MTAQTIPAEQLVVGDICFLKPGWRNQPPKLAVVPEPQEDRKAAHARDEDCGHPRCVGCYRAGRRTHPSLGAEQ